MLVGFKGMSFYCIVVVTASDSFFSFSPPTPGSGAVAPNAYHTYKIALKCLAQHSLGTSALGSASV